MANEIPEDIILSDILPRFPVKSICRFMCVSKQWYSSVMTNPIFANIQFQHQNHKLLFVSTETPYKFRTMDCEAPEDGFTPPRSFPFDVNSLENVSIVASLNGLVCVEIKKFWHDHSSRLILWNPFTGEYKILFRTYAHEEFLLYYTSFEDDYKFLCVTYSGDLDIYSLKSNSWRKVKSTEKFHRVADYTMLGASPLDEKVYFIQGDVNRNPIIYTILRFDLETEKFEKIASPCLENVTHYEFMVLRGSIHVWKVYHVTGSYRKIELWKMGGRDWTRAATNIAIQSLEYLHLMKNGNWLMIRQGEGYNLCKVHPGKPIPPTSYTVPKNLRLFSRVKYVETSVSPNQYIK